MKYLPLQKNGGKKRLFGDPAKKKNHPQVQTRAESEGKDGLSRKATENTALGSFLSYASAATRLGPRDRRLPAHEDGSPHRPLPARGPPRYSSQPGARQSVPPRVAAEPRRAPSGATRPLPPPRPGSQRATGGCRGPLAPLEARTEGLRCRHPPHPSQRSGRAAPSARTPGRRAAALTSGRPKPAPRRFRSAQSPPVTFPRRVPRRTRDAGTATQLRARREVLGRARGRAPRIRTGRVAPPPRPTNGVAPR